MLVAAIKRFGRTRGIAMAMFPMTGLAILACVMFGSIPLALLAGAKMKLVVIQLDSLAFEKELRGQRDASSSSPDASLTKADPL